MKTRIHLGLVVVGIVVSACVAAEQSSDDVEQNRQLLQKWRGDPARYGRLMRDFKAFVAEAPEKQERIRQFDRELHEEESANQARLWRVLQRYTEWIERLSPEQRQRIDEAKSAKERLQIVQEFKEQEWINSLPRATRERIQKASTERRPALIAQLRQEERRRQQEWEVAIKNWDELIANRPLPSRLSEFPQEVRDFVYVNLMPRLNQEEKDRLELAQGQWPLFPRTLVELADKHVLPFPGPGSGPSRPQDLPEGLRKSLQKLKNWPPPQVQRAEGRWPNYAMAVTVHARKRGMAVPPLGPARAESFSKDIQAFISNTLWPRLTDQEKEELNRSENRWPDYPRTLRDLAGKHGLSVPGMALPGPSNEWDRYRPTRLVTSEGQPQVPDPILIDFALNELTPAERAVLRVSFADPQSKERLKQEWIKRHPKDWDRLLQQDLQKQRKSRAAP